MEKKIIYIVVSSGGEYEDKYSNNEAATFDPVKAEAFRAELEAKQVTYNEVVEKVTASRNVVQELLGPQSHHCVRTDAVALQNFKDQLKARFAAIQTAKLELLISLGYDSRDMWDFGYTRDAVFSVEELEFI